ncbi:MAM domain-containing glycosylphosphatidylinositol anchor protein 1 isoform X2 [Lingula anatina]|uniref:MAM domain-containing glycosylphosphatidylinositol anchor protein 1 isoform X2 n=1 Tax=Lingula anatina TaxID=7574 RepID=A0A1S3K2J3_LINAN|nr:MAM domain-containing glycosylphosphatidylinositol anchor protein 1 isoform X2 [Lingula anatina]|eukprot:XP_013416614.1 MAM domain-containing glycosylphosphatidylinositol anchor protein 1 isoform X2 [Lingula anatina]
MDFTKMHLNTFTCLFLLVQLFQSRHTARLNTTKPRGDNSTKQQCQLDLKIPDYNKLCPDHRKQMHRHNVLLTKLIKAQEAFMSEMSVLIKQVNEKNIQDEQDLQDDDKLNKDQGDSANQLESTPVEKNGGILVATLEVNEVKNHEKQTEQLTMRLEYLTKQMNKQNEVLNQMILERSEYKMNLENMKMQMFDALRDFKSLETKVDTMQSHMTFQYRPQVDVAPLTEFHQTIYLDEQYALPVADPGSVVFECTFEKDLCGCAQDTDDDFEWTRHSKETTTRMTGPSHDHTTRGMGYYMYIETSPPLKPGDKARLTTPPMAMSKDGYCVQFYYHMFGYSTGSLSVYVNTGKDGRMRKTPVWTRTGNQGNIWHKAQVRLVAVDKVQVTFEGIRGFTGLGDIALDDILIRNGKCI